MQDKHVSLLSMSDDEFRRRMLSVGRAELLFESDADPVRDLKRAYRKHAELLESENDLVAFKAVELYDKRYGTLAPAPEVDRTPRFSVSIKLANPAQVDILPVISSNSDITQVNQALTRGEQTPVSGQEGVQHNLLGLDAHDAAQIRPGMPPPKPLETAERQGGPRRKAGTRGPKKSLARGAKTQGAP